MRNALGVILLFCFGGTQAATVSIDLSGAFSGEIINGIGADFAQTFTGQTVSGSSIIGSPTGPLTLAPSGNITVSSWNPGCTGCNAGNSLLPQPGNLAPLSILFDSLANGFNVVMGSADSDGLSSVTLDFFDASGDIVDSVVQSLTSGYNKYSFAGLGEFSGLTIRDNNDGAGLRYMDMTYNTTAVPVPAAVWLFGSALAALGFIRGRQTA